MNSPAQLAAIAARHGLLSPTSEPEPWVGATSCVYPIGDVVLKIPFESHAAIASLLTDAAMAPFARSLGVAAPELVALDDARDIVPVPYAIFRRVSSAAPLDRTDRSGDAEATWHEVGRQLALVHAVADTSAVPVELRTFHQTPDVDPRPWVNELQEAGRLSGNDAGWLRDMLDRIAPSALANLPLALCHGDVNAANVLADERSGRFRSLIDWAGAGWLDPVWDFAGVPLDVAPWMLAGHREVAPLPNDDTAEARILWCQVQTRLYIARAEESGDQVDIGQVRRFARLTGLAT